MRYSEFDLEKGVREDDPEVYLFIQKKIRPLVQSYILKNSGSVEDVDDIMQDAIFTLRTALTSPKYKSGNLLAFVTQVARNHWQKTLRKKKVYHQHLERFAHETDPVENPYAESARLWATYGDLVENMKRLGLDKLDEKCRNLIIWKKLKNYSAQKILTLQDSITTEGAVYARVNKCVHKLKKLLNSELAFPLHI